jgi:hypothetical protein
MARLAHRENRAYRGLKAYRVFKENKAYRGLRATQDLLVQMVSLKS